jgi:nitroreductase
MKSPISRRHLLTKLMAIIGGISFSSALLGKSTAHADTAQSGFGQNETLATIHKLRTIHGNFTAQDISDQDIQTILDATVRAANASAFQSYSIIVVKDREMIQKLTGYSGSRLLLFCVDYNRLKASAKHLGHEYYPGDMTSFITGSTNTILAAQTATIAAKSLGIDSLLTNGVHRGDIDRVWTLLDLPKELCYPLIALVLGYPDKEPDYLKGRLNGPGIVHHEKYHTLTPEELETINQKYNDKSLHLTLINNWEEQGCKNYLDWLFTKWLRRAGGPAQGETTLFAFLRRSGFVESGK